MTILAGTFTTFSAKGLREDLSDVIYNIAPPETPFVTTVGRTKADATKHEWQTDSLAAATTTNAQFQGDDISSFDSVTATARLGNYTQISRKTVIIAGTEEAVRKAGRKSEIAYQVAKKGKELKRDIEAVMVGANQAAAVGNATSAPLMASVLSWMTTNTDKQANGGDPAANDGTGVRTDSTTFRSFTEILLKGVLRSIWTNSGDEPEYLMVNGTMKQQASAFTGNATRMNDADSRRLFASVDVYEYDFGSVKIVPNRFMRTRDALIINSDLWAVAWLRPIRMEDLAKTGDATKKMLIGEYTLESRNEAGSGIVADLA